MKTKRLFCSQCKEFSVFEKERINHVLHLLLSVFTGVWFLVWIALAMSNAAKPYHCRRCGCPSEGFKGLNETCREFLLGARK